MATNIKITELTDITSANMTYNDLVAVVDMNGTPETKKSTVQLLGNLILSGAGGSYFAPAALATSAATVTTAAQPNITSVGTLSALTVTAAITGSVSGSAATAATVTTAAQPNITSVGTLTSLIVTGNVSASQSTATIHSSSLYSKLTPTTVSGLPVAGTAGAGARAMVTDSGSTTFNDVASGGGATTIPVFSDGTDWRIG